MLEFFKRSAGLTLIAACATMSCVSASADTLNNSKRIIIGQAYNYSFCMSMYGDAKLCSLKRSDQNCPDGYAIGGITWSTPAEACNAARASDACSGGSVQGC
jgi:hypothetical protein